MVKPSVLQRRAALTGPLGVVGVSKRKQHKLGHSCNTVSISDGNDNNTRALRYNQYRERICVVEAQRFFSSECEKSEAPFRAAGTLFKSL